MLLSSVDVLNAELKRLEVRLFDQQFSCPQCNLLCFHGSLHHVLSGPVGVDPDEPCKAGTAHRLRCWLLFQKHSRRSGLLSLWSVRTPLILCSC